MLTESLRRSHHHRSFVAVCLLATLVLGCGAATRELEQINAEHARTETIVKSALISDQSIDAASIQVIVNKDAIELSGFVGTQTESDKAESLARKYSKGIPVINSLEIR